MTLPLPGTVAVFIPAREGEKEEDVLKTEVTRIKPLVVYYLIAVFVGLTFYGFKTFMPVHFSMNATGLLENWDVVVRGGPKYNISKT